MLSENAVRARFIHQNKSYFIRIMLPAQPEITIPQIPGRNAVFPVPAGKYKRLFIVLIPDGKTCKIDQIVYKLVP